MKMVFRSVSNDSLKLSRLIVELMSTYQPGIYKELHCVVDSRPAHSVSFQLHCLVEGIGIEMVAGREYLLEDGKPFGGAPHFVSRQIPLQPSFRFRDELVIFHPAHKVTLSFSNIKIFFKEVVEFWEIE